MSESQRQLPEFEKPPLFEVAFAIQFEPLDWLVTAEVGDLWDAFGRDKYVNVQDHLISLPMRFNSNEIIYPDPNIPGIDRVWFLNDDETELIQFQKDRLVYNWRKRHVSPEVVYPRYSVLIEKFFEVLGSLEKFCAKRKKPLTYNMMELLYINAIPITEFDGLQNIGQCLENCSFKNNSDIYTEPQHFSKAVAYGLDELNAQMSYSAQTAESVEDGESVLRLDIRVRGLLAEPYDKMENGLRKWYNGSHDNIVLLFDAITSDFMHKKWGKK